MKWAPSLLLAVALLLGSCQPSGTSLSNHAAAPSQGLATIALPPEPSRAHASPTITSALLDPTDQSPATAEAGDTPPDGAPCIEIDFSGPPGDIPPGLVLLDDGLLRTFAFPKEAARTLGRQSYLAALSPGNHSLSHDASRLAFIETSPDPSGTFEETRELRIATALTQLPFSWPDTWLFIMGWAADGRLALMAPRTAPQSVLLLDLETNAPQWLEPPLNAPCGEGDGGLAPILYSPDLSLIAYPTSVSDSLCLVCECEWAVAAADSGRIFWTGPTVEVPQWSADGNRLAITVESGFLQQALVVVSPSREPTYLTSADDKSANSFPSVVEPSWSPDSKQIAAWVGHYGQYDTLETFSLIVADVESKAIRQYCINTDPIPYFHTPIWSPDGEWLALRTFKYLLDRYPPSEEYLLLLHIQSRKGIRIESDMPAIAWLAE